MKSLRKNKLFSLLSVILVALFLAIAIPSQAADSAMVVKGTIVSVDPNSGKVSVIDDTGKTVVLKATPDNDLKDLQKGDEVKIEYDEKNVIQSIDTQM
jgi:Cu/Ag efflux protein CusF